MTPADLSTGAAGGGQRRWPQDRSVGPPKPGWALVTGSTSGIGRETALCLAEAGYAVLITGRDRDRDRAEEVRREVAVFGVPANPPCSLPEHPPPDLSALVPLQRDGGVVRHAGNWFKRRHHRRPQRRQRWAQAPSGRLIPASSSGTLPRRQSTTPSGPRSQSTLCRALCCQRHECPGQEGGESSCARSSVSDLGNMV